MTATAPRSTSNNLADGVNMRRARLGVEGTFFKDFDYKFEYDFSRGNGSVAAGITDAFIKWNISKPLNIQVGSFKEPFSLEEATSNRYLTFIERNQAVNSFSDNPNAYKVGLAMNYAEDRYGFMAAVMTEPVGGNWAYNSSTNVFGNVPGNNTSITTYPGAGATAPNGGNSSQSGTNSQSNFNGSNNRNNGAGDIGWDVTARAFGRPWMEDKDKFVHVGASGSYRNVNNNYLTDGTFNNGGMQFTSTPNANVDRTAILGTGQLTNSVMNVTNGVATVNPTHRQVDHYTRFGAETAFVYGPFSAQAEYLRTDISGAGYKNTAFDGYYGYVSYFLTGESRNYKSKTGAWDRIKPAQNFNMNGGWGAWELAVGYDYLDLNGSAVTGSVNGGRASTAKVALNWYLNSHVRFMTNFVHVLDISTAAAAAGSRANSFNNANPDMVEMRAQVDW